MKITMLDIAKELGLSCSSVSLALSNSPKVAEATRERVLATAKRMGYRSNPYISALMAARRKGREPEHAPVLALLTPSATEQGWKKQGNLRRFVEGCQEHAGQLGLKTELFWIGDVSMTASRMNDILRNRGIKGAVLISNGPFAGKLKHEWKDVATLSFGAHRLEAGSDWVSGDYYGNMEEALRKLKDHGLRRIGFALDKPYTLDRHNRWVAAYLMEQQLGTIGDMEVWQAEDPSFDAFCKWFENAKPKAIVCVAPPLVIEWLGRMGLRVPEDVGVAAIGTAEQGGELSGIVVDTRTCGKLAIEMVLDRVHRGDFGRCEDAHHVTVSGFWNRGNTVIEAESMSGRLPR